MKQALMKTASPLLAPAIKSSLKSFYHAAKEISPIGDAKKVLVFAPHIDDETIGLGGTIRKHIAKGAEVHIAVVTDGKNSNSAKVQQQNLADIRKQELLSVQELLGFSSIIYMDHPDSRVSEAASSDDFRKAIEQVQPDIIYTTGLIDAHSDHVSTAHLVADALMRTGLQNVLVREYEINCPVPPEEINCIIDISDEFEIKRHATEIFKSQVIAFDGFLALAQIKASLVKEPGVRYVETFIESSPQQFIRAAENLKKRDLDYSRYFKQANRTVTLWWAIFKNIRLKRAFYKSRSQQ